MADQALAIANLKARYCRAADTAAIDEAAARALFDGLFAADFVGDFGQGPMVGPAVIVDYLCAAIGEGSVWMVHQLHSPRIEIDGSGATAEWTVTAHARRRGTDELSVVLGRYSDRFHLTPGGWRIARIVFERIG